MKKIILVSFLFIFSTISAQVKYEKGYYILNSGEKVDCYIKNIDWMDNPEDITCKMSMEDADFKVLTLTDISEFKIENISKYIRATVKIDYSSNNINQLTTDRNPKWKTKTVFLKVLTEGNATLYHYSSSGIYRFFFSSMENKAIEQLVYIKYISNENIVQGTDNFDSSIQTNSLFKNQLFSNLKCNSLTQADFDNLTYTKKALMKIVEKYNNCNGNSSSVSYEKKDLTKESFLFKLTPSINLATFTIDDPNKYNNLSTKISNVMVYKFGLEVEYILPFNNDKWSLFVNPAYQKISAEKEYVNNDGFGVISEDIKHKVVLDYSVIEIPFGVRYYSYLNPNLKMFYNAAYAYKVDFSSSKISFDNGATQNNITSRYNLSLGIGCSYKGKWSAELRSNLKAQILGGYIQWSTKFSSNGLVLGYKFL